MKDHYVTAVLQMLKDGKEITAVLEGLQKTLAAKGHTSLYASVLRGVLRVLETKTSADTVVFVAKESDKEALATEIKEALGALGAVSDPVVEVDETLIGGMVAKSNSVVVDRSYKTALINLYRSVTK